jgi:hypothetical protein
VKTPSNSTKNTTTTISTAKNREKHMQKLKHDGPKDGQQNKETEEKIFRTTILCLPFFSHCNLQSIRD